MKNFKGTASNILSVARSDVKRLSRSVVAVVCVFCLALVPCLYAWFNIISNWSPYTPDATKNLKIAVASEDEGTTFLGMDFNIGNIIIERLKTDNQIDWQFPESAQAVTDGLYSGDYYAGIVIPEDFSGSMLGFTDGEFEQPEIIYYDNQKMNVIASRVTDRAQTFIKDEINGIFVATIVEELSTFTSMFSGMGVDSENTLEGLDGELENIKADLRAYISIMDSMASVTQSASNVASMTNNLLPDVVDMLNNSRSTIADMKDRLATSKEDIIYAADAIRNSSEELRNTVEKLDSAVDGDPAEAGKSYVDWDALYGEGGITEYEGEILDDLYYDINKQLHESVIRFDDILQQTNIDSNLINSMTTLQSSLDNLDSLLASIESDVDGQAYTLQQFTSALNSCTQSINGTRDVMNSMLQMVTNVQSNINDLRSSESFSNLLDLMNNDIAGLVEYLSSPANLEVVRVYALENFGSGMAPFYTVLSLWACALLSVSLLHTHIKRREEFPNLTTTEAFFGRFIIFFAVGQLCTLLTVFGNLFYIGIQCYSPFQYWLAAAVASLLFTLINYGFVFAFGNIGEAIAIIVLVIQVAGAGGTYPIQMLPKVFQVLNGIMPFNFAMTAMRETIAGSYNGVYLKNILIMLLICIVLVPVFLLCHKLYKPTLNKFAESKAKTGLMHGG
ncbi:MAG: YhgE/Pip family protein [Oscillospiraceae bacterium]